MKEDLDIRRRKAVWRATHRGTKELDLLIGRYAQARLMAMNERELGHFEDFLHVADPELQIWLLSPVSLPEVVFADLVTEMRKFHGLTTQAGREHEQVTKPQ